jgi:hypothetical protein
VIPAPAVLRGWLARLVLAVALPAAVLTAARLLQLQSAHLPENVGALLPWLPYLLLGPGLLLALLFGRGRAFFLLLLLAGFYWVLSQPLGWRVHGARLDADALRLGLACLLPLNVAASVCSRCSPPRAHTSSPRHCRPRRSACRPRWSAACWANRRGWPSCSARCCCCCASC